MNVLLYSHCFYPSVGGLETVSLSLAEGFFSNHIDVKVVTRTSSKGVGQFPFEIIRNPTKKQQIALVKWADVILFNGASLSLLPWILFHRRPFVWVHVGYQVSCIDGLGWEDGKPAPIKPWDSFLYHCRLKGWKHGVKAGVKLLVRRAVAKHAVTKNIAITEWMYHIQPLPRQVHIYNPFPIDQFICDHSVEPEYDFLYLGRIVSEKGVPTLLKAFAKVYALMKSSRLLIIGDGDMREKMELLAKELEIYVAVTFIGKKTGAELVQWVAKARIAVIPSEWYEPMGGVAIELMASGKNLIVSEKGGLKECVGEAGLSFPNGNAEALAERMARLLKDPCLRKTLLEKGKERIKCFAPSFFISQYIELLKEAAKLS